MTPDEVREIVDRHCRHSRNGKTVMCKSSHREDADRASRVLAPLRPKVIYDSAEAAERCAKEIQQAIGGPLMRAYPCRRSRHGHHHLTGDAQRAGKGQPRKLVTPSPYGEG